MQRRVALEPGWRVFYMPSPEQQAETEANRLCAAHVPLAPPAEGDGLVGAGGWLELHLGERGEGDRQRQPEPEEGGIDPCAV